LSEIKEKNIKLLYFPYDVGIVFGILSFEVLIIAFGGMTKNYFS
jgi:hypothetical protein